MSETVKSKPKKVIRPEILDFSRLILVCLVITFMFMNFVLHRVTVEGSSMYPTLVDKESGLSNILSTYISEVKRFEVVVVKSEETDGDQWVKRVIGLPNEKVEYRNNQLYINDQPVKESFLNTAFMNAQTNNGEIPFSRNYGPITLKDDEYFVCGDNRLVSKDSRVVGPFKKKDIVSKHVIIISPFNEMRIVSGE